jgi:hypothetical protein
MTNPPDHGFFALMARSQHSEQEHKRLVDVSLEHVALINREQLLIHTRIAG